MHYYKHKEIEFHVDNPNFLFTQLTVDSHTKDQMKTVIENEQDTVKKIKKC